MQQVRLFSASMKHEQNNWLDIHLDSDRNRAKKVNIVSSTKVNINKNLHCRSFCIRIRSCHHPNKLFVRC